MRIKRLMHRFEKIVAIYGEILSIPPISSDACNQILPLWSVSSECWSLLIGRSRGCLFGTSDLLCFFFSTSHQVLVSMPPTQSSIQCTLHHTYTVSQYSGCLPVTPRTISAFANWLVLNTLWLKDRKCWLCCFFGLYLNMECVSVCLSNQRPAAVCICGCVCCDVSQRTPGLM